ncbi:unnamed protein product [Bemisia tabaci]|uniref:Major facilitator superfamily (MFS) profile domain-containing protein n=1 Tax=Bemisia tabaci TaxID=7038 RepID=A0A9P0CA77_BEMTA|nr:unnamed protein product [Bemisia tabaci]
MASIIRKHIFNQLLSSITAFLTLFLSGVWLGWISVVLPKVHSGEIPVPMSGSDITWAVVGLDIGNFLSPLPTGYLMDRYGRLPTLRLAMLFFAAASVLALVASTPLHFFLARLLAGVGKGAGFTAAALYVAEIAGPRIRGALSGVFIVMLTGGLVVSVTVGPWLSFATVNWLILLFPVLGLVLTFFVVESPYYRCMRGDSAAAEKALAAVRDRTKVAARTSELELIRLKVAEEQSAKKSAWTLVSERGNRRALAIVLVTGILERAGGVASIMAYASSSLPRDAAGFWDGKLTVMLFSWLCVGSGLLGVALVDSCGRKPLQLVSCLGLAGVTAASSVFYYYHQKAQEDAAGFVWVPHACIVLFGVFYPFGVGQIPHTFQSELFPTSVKGHASAIMTMALAVASFASNKLYLAVDLWLVYAAFALCNLASAVFTLFCVFETKGKTLAEIQDLLDR